MKKEKITSMTKTILHLVAGIVFLASISLHLFQAYQGTQFYKSALINEGVQSGANQLNQIIVDTYTQKGELPLLMGEETVILKECLPIEITE